MKQFGPCLFLLLSMISHSTFAEREIAITIDDLPFVGTDSSDSGNLKRSHERFMRIVQSLIDNQVPATGFIIAGAIGKGQWHLLEEFRNEGFALGNHTYSHANLNRITAEQYIEEIAKADKILTPVMTQPKYFRYPYLAEGKGEVKQEIQDYLAANQYIVAPVTIDSKDYQFNERLLRISWRIRNQYLQQIKNAYLGYIWQQTLLAEKRSKPQAKQILLVHANLLNSYFLGDVIKMYKKNGYKFISLDEALTNSATATANMVPHTKPPSAQEDKTTRNQISQDVVWLTAFEKVW